MRSILGAPIAACGLLCSLIGAAAENRGIRGFHFNRYFNRQYLDCLDKSKARNAVVNLTITYHDFAGDGVEEAMVVGTSCHSGTAGPDIHSVYRLNTTSRLRELKIGDDQTFQGNSIYSDLIGNRNFTFEVVDGDLCEAFTDSSGRERPLTVCYKLKHYEFVIDQVTRGPTYRASFDCTTAREAWARTVCGTKDLASADIEVQSLYQKLEQLHIDQKAKLEAERRDWQKQLSEASTSKFFGDFLRDAYAARIEDLRARLK